MIGLGDFSSPNIFRMIFPPTMNNPKNSHLYLYLYLYVSALSKSAIISNIIELILHSLCLSKQSDLLTLYNFEANPNYLFVTGLCHIQMAVLLIVDKTYFSQLLISSEYKVCVRICSCFSKFRR